MDQFSNAGGKFVQIEYIRDLHTDIAHQDKLSEAELLDFGSMRGNQTDRNNLGEALKQVELFAGKTWPLGTGNLENAQSNPMIFERHRGKGLVRSRVFCPPGLGKQLARFDRPLHSFKGWLRRKYGAILPIWQAENFLLQPDVHHAFQKAARHGYNSVTLCTERIFAPQLIPKAGKLKPIP